MSIRKKKQSSTIANDYKLEALEPRLKVFYYILER